ncbi:MAG: single-stranded DNA-binding protein [Candidatus Omnitrophica bacterium]|nr:single-stranded DNA-binding protein [Candidatus Omnitrophota bacterium]
MASLNKVFLMGNLTRDPELRYLPSGTAVTTFTVAVNRVYKLQSGEKKEEVTFMPIVVWGRRAETCGEYLNKGSAAFVEGRLRNRSWQGQDGQKRSVVEVVADNVQFMQRARSQSAQQAPAAEGEAQQPLDIAPDVDVPPGNSGPTGMGPKEEIPF